MNVRGLNCYKTIAETRVAPEVETREILGYFDTSGSVRSGIYNARFLFPTRESPTILKSSPAVCSAGTSSARSP